MQGAPPVWELKAAALNNRIGEQINSVRFSASEELIWSGTERGYLYASIIPDVERYCSFKAHRLRTLEVVPLPPTVSDGALSISAESVRYHSSGGYPRFTYTDNLGKDLTACAVDTQHPQKAILGRSSGKISMLDVQTGQLLETVGPLAAGVQLIRTPAPRGMVAFGCSSGQIALADPRAQFKTEQVIVAHSGGLLAMDVSGGLMATAGLGTRQGHLVPDTIVKVYDLRMTARVTTTIPFSPGPSLLRFHPRFPGTLLLASGTGHFLLSPVQAAAFAPLMQVETEGDMLTCVDFSSSGECLAFGGSGGFVHVWGYSQEPRVNLRSTPLEVPPLKPQPATTLEEDQPFSIAAVPYYTEGKLLSEWDAGLMGRPGAAPRTVDLSLLKNIKQVDFVTYIPNPHHRRDRPRGEAAKKVAGLRNCRVQPRAGALNGFANASHAVPQAFASELPHKYRKVLITQDVDRRYEEFNFAKYNRTRFAGLENGIANCYANALIQVLYFIPDLRAFFLGATPDPALEFSLLDELALLFRMLSTESGHACQATNLLRALRQSREATGLGLLEGHAQKGAHGADIEVEANKDRSLARRIQGLQRFLLDKLHHEILQRNPRASPTPPPAPTSEAEASKKAVEKESSPSGEAEARSVPGETSGRTSSIDQVFGIRMRQRMQGLQGTKPVLEKEIRCFQVDLQYPRRSKPPAATAKEAKPEAPAEHRPSFGDVVVSSLKAEGETRAWFNDQLKYQYVRQSRQPLAWPQVLALGTGLQDRSNLFWWQPTQFPEGGGSVPGPGSGKRAWAPWVLALEMSKEGMLAQEADRVDALPPQSPDCTSRAVYELTAIVALVQEEDAMLAQGQGQLFEVEGHLIAHVRVPASYLDKDVGTLPTPRAKPPSPGFAATRYYRPAAKFEPGSPLAEHRFEGLPEDPFGEEATEEAREREGAAAEHNLPDDPFGEPATAGNRGEAEGGGVSKEGAHPGSLDLPDASLPSEGKLTEGEATQLAQAQAAEEAPASVQAESATEAADPEPPRSEASQPLNSASDPADVPERFANLKVSAERADSHPRTASGGLKPAPDPVWLLINDFSILQTPKADVMQLYNGHKLPCLMYYTQVSGMQKDTRQDFTRRPSPVLQVEQFHSLCRQPPLQTAMLGVPRLGKPTFWPLLPAEGPTPGLLLGLDAEFVAFSPPSKALRGGVEIETSPSRLGLARVSVVRGEGRQAGKACIDDYIRATEPVYDFLTQYSGLKPGDLDPAMSTHHLTSLKASYLKLRHLVDIGCIFVGHGLKKDFRMINMLVPQEQVVDTVDLFYLKRQRKISLRFLAAYLLGQHIQQVTHDSIEDARTALSLYKLYTKLQKEDRVRDVLENMYAWGKQHAWDPAALKESPRDPVDA